MIRSSYLLRYNDCHILSYYEHKKVKVSGKKVEPKNPLRFPIDNINDDTDAGAQLKWLYSVFISVND